MFGLEFFLPQLLGLAAGAGAAYLMSKNAPDYSAEIARSNAAHQAAMDALDEKNRALKKAEESMVPAADSEAARVAAESRQRRLRSRQTTLFGGDDELGSPNVAFRQLMGG